MENPKKILIIRFSSIGDIVLSSPLIRVLRTAYPKAQIDFLVKSEYAELVKFNHHLSSVIELKSSEKIELQKLKQKIREERYDIIFDIHNSLRSRYLRAFSGAKNIAVINKRITARFFLVRFKWNFYDRIISVVDRYLETAAQFGIHDDGKGLEIFIPDETMFSVASIMGKFKLERYNTVIGLAPTAKHVTKRWQTERFVELGIKLAKEHHAKIFIFGGREDTEYCGDMAQMINSAVSGSVSENFAGKFSLLETASALEFCDVVVSNDTGVMHLASAKQRKVVAIFGSTVGELGFFPYKTETIIVEHHSLECRPCSHVGLNSCPEGHFKCMKDISVDNIVKATKILLSSNN